MNRKKFKKNLKLIDSDEFMGLQAEFPAWVSHAIFNCGFGIGALQGIVQRLQVIMLKIEICKALWHGLSLWVDELQFITCGLYDFRTAFRADTDPVDTLRYG